MKSLTLPKQLAMLTTALSLGALVFMFLLSHSDSSLAISIIFALLSSAGIGLVVGLFSRSRTRAIDQLTDAAVRMGSGDLSTPIQANTRSEKVDRLAQTLEKMRAQLSRNLEELTVRRRAETYFLASMSHEFRTPLAGMQASLELLQENFRALSPEETQQLLNSIQLSQSMLHQLIDNLLETGKLESNHFTLNRRESAVDPLLGEAVHLVEPMLSRREQRLTFEAPLDMPRLQLDPTRSIQMIVNLLSNASKYSPVGSVIGVIITREDGCVRVSIADRGRGISPEQRNNLFLPFVRLEPESALDHGSGLGLAVVKAIAEAHHGRVGVEAREGGGSIFWFTLPSMESAP